MKGDYEAKEERMQKYLKLVQRLLPHLDDINFQLIPRIKNTEADFLTRLTSSDEYNIGLELYMEIQEQPSIEGSQIMAIHKQANWTTPIMLFSKEGQLPEDKAKARKVQIRATRFVIINEVLYR